MLGYFRYPRGLARRQLQHQRLRKSNTDTNGYGYSDCHGHSYSYCYANGHSYCDGDTEGYADTKAPPDTGASPVVKSEHFCRGTCQLPLQRVSDVIRKSWP